MIDVGTGTGILAIAAKLSGAGETFATDIDHVAVRVAAENIERNGQQVTVRQGDLLSAVEPGAVFDLAIANIIADVIIALCGQIVSVLRSQGKFICSASSASARPTSWRRLKARGLRCRDSPARRVGGYLRPEGGLMHRFYLPDAPTGEAGFECALSTEEAQHAGKVLRLKTGDEVECFDGRGHAWLCSLRFDGARATVCAREPLASNESPIRLTLYQGLPKLDKLDLIVQKATELGAWRIVPVAWRAQWRGWTAATLSASANAGSA